MELHQPKYATPLAPLSNRVVIGSSARATIDNGTRGWSKLIRTVNLDKETVLVAGTIPESEMGDP